MLFRKITIRDNRKLSGGRSLAWTRTSACHYINWSKYREFIYNKYRSQYASMQFNYAKKYHFLINDPGGLLNIPNNQNILKALVCLSKYLGKYVEFKNNLKAYGIKWKTTDSFNSFLRILDANKKNASLKEWYKSAYAILEPNEKLFLKFLAISGMRTGEAIASFNLIISLAREDRLNEYYNEELQCLEHFKFKQFLRGSKNIYMSFIPKQVIIDIINSAQVSYPRIRKRLNHNGLELRLNELRDQFATFMVRHGLIREEVDLLQGRVPKTIFTRHYWSPSLLELRDRVFKALAELEQIINR